MKRVRFLIPSLLAAGFGAQDAVQATAVPGISGGDDDPGKPGLFRMFKLDHQVSLAQHRSHSSHSSHSSHRSGSGGHFSHSSHRSSTGGYDPDYTVPYSAPAPSPSPPPSPSSSALPLRSAQPGEATPPPQDSTARTLSGRSDRFKAIVRRVQIGLLAQGYYSGAIDGVVGSSLRGAIRKFQASRSIEVTGTITPAVLDALRISSD